MKQWRVGDFRIGPQKHHFSVSSITKTNHLLPGSLWSFTIKFHLILASGSSVPSGIPFRKCLSVITEGYRKDAQGQSPDVCVYFLSSYLHSVRDIFMKTLRGASPDTNGSEPFGFFLSFPVSLPEVTGRYLSDCSSFGNVFTNP